LITSPPAPCVLCLAEAERSGAKRSDAERQAERSGATRSEAERQAERSGGAGWSSQHFRSVGPSTVAARLPATRAPLDRREEPVPCETPAPMPGVWLLAFETTTSSLTLADDGELVVNPPTLRQIGKHPPAPKKSGRPAKGARWRTPSVTLARRLSPRSTRPSLWLVVGAVSRYTRPLRVAGRHFELVRRGLTPPPVGPFFRRNFVSRAI